MQQCPEYMVVLNVTLQLKHCLVVIAAQTAERFPIFKRGQADFRADTITSVVSDGDGWVHCLYM